MSNVFAPLTRTVDTLNLASGIVSASDGALGDIGYFLDDDGDETMESDGAVVAMVKWRDCDLWSAVNVWPFLMARRH